MEQLPDNRKLQMIKRRTAELAKPIQEENLLQSVVEVLVFRLAKELYAIETTYIKEVYPLKDYTVLPCTPTFIYGLINLRRKILAVIDLKVFFDLPDLGTDDKKVIILHDASKDFALLTDGVIEIKKLTLDDVQAALPTLTGVRLEFLKGITTDGIVILDGQKLLASKRIVVDETVGLTH